MPTPAKNSTSVKPKDGKQTLLRALHEALESGDRERTYEAAWNLVLYPKPTTPLQPATTEQILRKFRIFNEKVEVLHLRSYIGKSSAPGAGFSFKWSDVTTTLTHSGADDEATDAYILTFRLFFLKKDGIGISEILSHYQNMNVTDELKSWASSMKNDFNIFLDEPGDFQLDLGNGPLPNRRIFDVFLYGGYAHVNDDENKRNIFESWRKSPFFALLRTKFDDILMELHKKLLSIREKNVEVIHHLQQ